MTDASPVPPLAAFAALTQRQQQVARYVALGWTDMKIAKALEVGEDTVRYHIDEIVRRWALDRSKNIRVQIAHRFLEAA